MATQWAGVWAGETTVAAGGWMTAAVGRAGVCREWRAGRGEVVARGDSDTQRNLAQRRCLMTTTEVIHAPAHIETGLCPHRSS